MDAFIIAFSMYSKIPMPRREWTSKGMKYAICFFPVVGMVIGLIVELLGWLLCRLEWQGIFYPCFMTILPIFITGGIHMDGFLDTMDGISSYQTKERRLEILKDSNSGAFAIIGGLVYMILSIGAWSEVSVKSLPVIACSYCLSRAISGFCLVNFRQARKKGLAATFNDGADKKTVSIVMVILGILDIALAFIINPAGALVLIISAVITVAFHYYNCMKNFGGITGDLAGFFLQVFELAVVAGCMICEKAGVM